MHLNTKKCCEYVFSAADIKPPLLRQPQVFQTPDSLYGGHAERFTEATCPECGKDYHLWLKQEGQSWKVLTISPRGWETDKPNTKKKNNPRAAVPKRNE